MLENDNNNLNSVPLQNETVLEEVCFDTKMAFDELSSPSLAYTFAKADFDPDERKYCFAYIVVFPLVSSVE